MALILVVDDDPEIRQMVEQKLSGAGHEVITESDGDRALETAGDRRPDAVLVDWMIPGRSGIDVCRALRQSSDAVVFLMTARSQADDVQRGYEAGADRYIVKPFSPRELLSSVEDALATRAEDGDRAR